MKVTQRLQSHPTDPSQKDWKVHSIPKSDLCDKECDARKIHEEDRGGCPLVVLCSVWRFFDKIFINLWNLSFFTLTRQINRQCWCRMPNPDLILESIKRISILVSISIIMISISLKNQPLSTWTTTMKSMIMLAMVPVELSISFFFKFSWSRFWLQLLLSRFFKAYWHRCKKFSSICYRTLSKISSQNIWCCVCDE